MPAWAFQYARFAPALRDLRDTWVLPLAGYTSDEPLPTDLPTLLEDAAANIRRCAGVAPFALVGHSSGGWLAHALTSHLEQAGASPHALVLLDTPPDAAPARAAALVRSWVNQSPNVNAASDCELAAMGWYFQLFAGWTPAAIATPTLLVRPSGAGGTHPHHASLEVPGDHGSMMDRHADATAQAVHRWLAEGRPPGPSDAQARCAGTRAALGSA